MCDVTACATRTRCFIITGCPMQATLSNSTDISRRKAAQIETSSGPRPGSMNPSPKINQYSFSDV